MNASPTEIQHVLAGADYPATRSDLIAHAEETSASDDVITDLESLDEDEFDGPAAVMTALGGEAEDLDEDEDYEEDDYSDEE